MTDNKTSIPSFWKMLGRISLFLIIIPFLYIGIQWSVFEFGQEFGALLAGNFLILPLYVYLAPPSLIFGKHILLDCSSDGHMTSLNDGVLVFIFYFLTTILVAGYIYMKRNKKTANQRVDLTR